MNQEKFDILLEEIIKRTKTVLKAKSNEYSSDTDKLHNFKRAGQLRNSSPEEALAGMLAKHLVSLLDIVDEIEKTYPIEQIFPPSYHDYIKLLEEKITDSINYLILLEGLIKERCDMDE